MRRADGPRRAEDPDRRDRAGPGRPQGEAGRDASARRAARGSGSWRSVPRPGRRRHRRLRPGRSGTCRGAGRPPVVRGRPWAPALHARAPRRARRAGGRRRSDRLHPAGDAHQGIEAGPHGEGRGPAADAGQIILRRGDVLRLLRRPGPGRAAATDAAGRSLSLAEIGISDPAIFDDLEPGHHVLVRRRQDRRVVARRAREGADVELVIARAGRAAASGGKGHQPARHRRGAAGPDGGGPAGPRVRRVPRRPRRLFVRARSAEDVRPPAGRLAKRQAAQLGIVLKIETRRLSSTSRNSCSPRCAPSAPAS